VPAKKPWPPETIARLRELWKANVSATRIGAELGFTKNAIIGKARREGLSPRDTRFAAEIAIKVETEEDRQTIRRLWPTHSVTYIKTKEDIPCPARRNNQRSVSLCAWWSGALSSARS